MHEETIRELVDSCVSIFGTLAKEEFIHRKRVDMEQERRETQLELAKARERSQEASPTDTTPEPAGREQLTSGDVDPSEEIDRLMQEETCSTCRQLLSGLKGRPLNEQIRGIMEYGQFKRDLADGANVDELKEALRQTQVLKTVFEEDIRSRPL